MSICIFSSASYQESRYVSGWWEDFLDMSVFADWPIVSSGSGDALGSVQPRLLLAGPSFYLFIQQAFSLRHVAGSQAPIDVERERGLPT